MRGGRRRRHGHPCRCGGDPARPAQLAGARDAVPISITVEANILPLMIIYGQGAIRCHPCDTLGDPPSSPPAIRRQPTRPSSTTSTNRHARRLRHQRRDRPHPAASRNRHHALLPAPIALLRRLRRLSDTIWAPGRNSSNGARDLGRLADTHPRPALRPQALPGSQDHGQLPAWCAQTPDCACAASGGLLPT